MTNYIIYSHTSYLKILQIQTDHICHLKNTTLIINENDLDISYIYEKYKKVLFYKDTDPYATRLLNCIKKIDDEYFVLIHDIDILLNVDDNVIGKLTKYLKINKHDRIDLKYTGNVESSLIVKADKNYDPSEWKSIKKEEICEGTFLIKQENINEYLYNVNPSIWRKDTLLEIMEKFKHCTYRNIEYLDTQIFCKKFNIFKLYSEKFLECGYLNCLVFFKFFHISHRGNILKFNDSKKTEYGQSYIDASFEYLDIISKYKLQ